MKEFVLDCAKMTDKETAHEYLAHELSFPSYYGKNLDALHDSLAELAPCRIKLLNGAALKNLGEYGNILLRVFSDLDSELKDFNAEIRL